jgi:hypothetical protein
VADEIETSSTKQSDSFALKEIVIYESAQWVKSFPSCFSDGAAVKLLAIRDLADSRWTNLYSVKPMDNRLIGSPLPSHQITASRSPLVLDIEDYRKLLAALRP